MRINDKDVKELIDTVNRIHSKVDVIETKLEGIKGCNEEQDMIITKHTSELQKLAVGLRGLEVKVWLLLVAGGTIGGILGSLFSKFVGG